MVNVILAVVEAPGLTMGVVEVALALTNSLAMMRIAEAGLAF